MTAERQPLTRREHLVDGQPRYYHPFGYTITRSERDWDWVRGSAGWSPKVMWDVRRFGRSRLVESFPTLRQARAWCDEQEDLTS